MFNVFKSVKWIINLASAANAYYFQIIGFNMRGIQTRTAIIYLFVIIYNFLDYSPVIVNQSIIIVLVYL